jgi:hypothetical protein
LSSDRQDGTSSTSDEFSEWVDRWYAWYEENGAECFGLSGVEQPATTSQANEPYPNLDLAPPGPNMNVGPVVTNQFQCMFCGKGFDRRQRLEACMNQHRGERPYVCDASCGRDNWCVHIAQYLLFAFPHSQPIDSTTAFTSQANLTRHLRDEKNRYRKCEYWYVACSVFVVD